MCKKKIITIVNKIVQIKVGKKTNTEREKIVIVYHI